MASTRKVIFWNRKKNIKRSLVLIRVSFHASKTPLCNKIKTNLMGNRKSLPQASSWAPRETGKSLSCLSKFLVLLSLYFVKLCVRTGPMWMHTDYRSLSKNFFRYALQFHYEGWNLFATHYFLKPRNNFTTCYSSCITVSQAKF